MAKDSELELHGSGWGLDTSTSHCLWQKNGHLEKDLCRVFIIHRAG